MHAPIGQYQERPYVAPQSPPSTYAIAALLEDEDGAEARVLKLTVKRMVLIAPGLWLVGRRGKALLKESAAASLSITAALLLIYARRRRISQRATGTSAPGPRPTPA